MAEIVLGIGCAHAPQLHTPVEEWEHRAARDTMDAEPFWYKGERMGAHRWAFKLNGGVLIKGMEICHKCVDFGSLQDNPWCVNPEHLYQGTKSDNMQDSKKAGTLRFPGGKGYPNKRIKLK